MASNTLDVSLRFVKLMHTYLSEPGCTPGKAFGVMMTMRTYELGHGNELMNLFLRTTNPDEREFAKEAYITHLWSIILVNECGNGQSSVGEENAEDVLPGIRTGGGDELLEPCDPHGTFMGLRQLAYNSPLRSVFLHPIENDEEFVAVN